MLLWHQSSSIWLQLTERRQALSGFRKSLCTFSCTVTSPRFSPANNSQNLSEQKNRIILVNKFSSLGKGYFKILAIKGLLVRSGTLENPGKTVSPINISDLYKVHFLNLCNLNRSNTVQNVFALSLLKNIIAWKWKLYFFAIALRSNLGRIILVKIVS